MPTVFDLSSRVGYTTGGLNLTIKGYGFDYGTPHVTVDGVNCTVTRVEVEEMDCTVQPATKESDHNMTTVGSHGVRRTIVTNPGSHVHLKYINDTSKNYTTEEKLAMTMSIPYNEENYYGNILKGWFIPPATTKYRFYMACDDDCDLSMGKTPGKGPDVNDTQHLISDWSTSSYR